MKMNRRGEQEGDGPRDSAVRSQRRGVTLATIAAELGVSRMTVSNAYNHPDQLSPELREKVLETAKRLGYPGPNPLAATLSRGRVGALGLLFDDPLSYAFTDPASVLFFGGIAEVCEQRQVGLVLVPSGVETLGQADLTRVALVDGFIAYCDLADDGRLEAIEERGLPMVIVEGPRRPGAHHVGLDDRGAARAAARHLIDLGHRRFGVIPFQLAPDRYEGAAGPERQAATRFHTSRERLRGYRDALEAAGIDWATVPVEERIPHGRDAGRRSAGALLDRAERPTALLAMSDELAIGALQAAEDRGIVVPRELSVVGFDDTPAAGHARPPLTTIWQPHREKGVAAARLLLEPGEAGGPVEAELTLPTELVVRASSAPAPP
jgi:DNA-binding LacI/PurR family transcriptional regulator